MVNYKSGKQTPWKITCILQNRTLFPEPSLLYVLVSRIILSKNNHLVLDITARGKKILNTWPQETSYIKFLKSPEIMKKWQKLLLAKGQVY